MTQAWEMKYQNTSDVWSAYWEIDNPTNEISVTRITNRSKTKLIDGSLTRRIPTTKYNYEPSTIEFGFVSASSVLLVAGAVSIPLDTIFENQYKIKIKDHEDVEWEGYLDNYADVYKLGQYNSSSGYQTFYDLSIVLDIISLA